MEEHISKIADMHHFRCMLQKLIYIFFIAYWILVHNISLENLFNAQYQYQNSIILCPLQCGENME